MATGNDRRIAPAVLEAYAREFWEYYRHYTKTGVHAAATATLTAFGLLIFIDPLFAWLAIASYVLPPIVLYLAGLDLNGDSDNGDHPVDADRHGGTNARADSDVVADTANTDTSGRGAGVYGSGPSIGRSARSTDSDGVDSDTDSNSNGGDTDSDSSDGDTDSDGDDGDTDSDG